MNRFISVGRGSPRPPPDRQAAHPFRHHHPGARHRHLAWRPWGLRCATPWSTASCHFANGERFARFNVYDREGGRIDLDLARYHLFLEKAAAFEHVGAVGARPFTIKHRIRRSRIGSWRASSRRARCAAAGVADRRPHADSRRRRARRRTRRLDPRQSVEAALRRRAGSDRPPDRHRRPDAHRHRRDARHVRVSLLRRDLAAARRPDAWRHAASADRRSSRVWRASRRRARSRRRRSKLNELSQQVSAAEGLNTSARARASLRDRFGSGGDRDVGAGLRARAAAARRGQQCRDPRVRADVGARAGARGPDGARRRAQPRRRPVVRRVVDPGIDRRRDWIWPRAARARLPGADDRAAAVLDHVRARARARWRLWCS